MIVRAAHSAPPMSASSDFGIPRLSYRISEFSQATGICRTRLYEEIAAGRLRTVKFGRPTLIFADDANAFLAGLRGAS